MKFAQRGQAVLLAWLLLPEMCAADPRTDLLEFNIPAQTLEKSLQDFRLQAPDVSLLEPAEISATGTAPAVRGRFTAETALALLLKNSAVTVTFVPPNILTLHQEWAAGGTAGTADGSEAISEIFIRGSRTLNTDQRRSQDDPFAYVIFDSEAISRSSWADARSFLAAELPAYSTRSVSLGVGAITGATGQITMRGLPSTETVILFDGHRRAGTFTGGELQQPDVSMTPLSLLERVEVRTASASALFGSDAVVGAINLIRDRKTPRTRIFLRDEELTEFSAGTQQFSAEHVREVGQGRGWLALDGALLRQKAITLRQRNFLTAGRLRTHSNFPEFWDCSSSPPLGSLRNLRATCGNTFPINGGVRYLYLPADFQVGDNLSQLTTSAGQYDLTLASSAQVLGEFSTVRPKRETHSVSAAGGWNFATRFSVDLDAGFAESLREGSFSTLDDVVGQAFFVPAAHPANPLRQDLLASRGTNVGDGPLSRRDQSIYATVGATWLMSEAAMLRVDDAWSTSSATIRQAVLEGDTSGLIALLMSPARDVGSLARSGMWLSEESGPQYSNLLNETTLRFTHSRVMLPAGPASVTLTAQRLFEKTADPTVRDPARDQVAAQRARSTMSTAVSANVPLLRPRVERGPTRLALDLGVRRDSVVIQAAPNAVEQRDLRFSAVSLATGLRWQVQDSVSVRAECTTGFLPPPLSSISDRSPLYLEDLHLTDPARGGEQLDAALVIAGGNYDLRPERSRACGGGFVLEQSGDELAQVHWRFSADYTRSVKTGGVLTPEDLFFANPQKYLNDFPERIRRAAPGAPIYAIETWSINSASQIVESIDVRFDWSRRLSAGSLGIYFIGSAQPVSRGRLAPSMSRENEAGIGNLASPIWRGVASLAWKGEELAMGANARYTSPYDVSRLDAILKSQGRENVASQTYLDLYVAYTLPRCFVQGAQLRLDARNVLHRDPPVDLAETGYASRFGLDEFASLSLSLNVRL